MVKSRTVKVSSPQGKNLDTESRSTKSELWELIASQRRAIYQTKNNLGALPSLPKLSVKFQRNRLPNVQDTTFFSVRPPPKFCLINLFMNSLSPVALTHSNELARSSRQSFPLLNRACWFPELPKPKKFCPRTTLKACGMF